MYWKYRSSAWGRKKVFLARSGQLRSRRFPSTPLLITQQKETEFSNLFRVSFANLQKQGEIFPCSLQHLVGEAAANIRASLPTAQPGVTQSSPGGAGTAGPLLPRHPGVIRALTPQLLHNQPSKETPRSEPSLNR